jgi:hypothetical protein
LGTPLPGNVIKLRRNAQKSASLITRKRREDGKVLAPFAVEMQKKAMQISRFVNPGFEIFTKKEQGYRFDTLLFFPTCCVGLNLMTLPAGGAALSARKCPKRGGLAEWPPHPLTAFGHDYAETETDLDGRFPWFY